jgi:hypothetical protein
MCVYISRSDPLDGLKCSVCAYAAFNSQVADIIQLNARIQCKCDAPRFERMNSKALDGIFYHSECGKYSVAQNRKDRDASDPNDDYVAQSTRNLESKNARIEHRAKRVMNEASGRCNNCLRGYVPKHNPIDGLECISCHANLDNAVVTNILIRGKFLRCKCDSADALIPCNWSTRAFFHTKCRKYKYVVSGRVAINSCAEVRYF